MKRGSTPTPFCSELRLFSREAISLIEGVLSVIGIFRQQLTVPLPEELNDSRFEVVHRAYNLYATAGFEVPKHSALFPNVGDSQ